mmetsp:Transcript_103471/g.267621  ORF Transcript_103471/g.267621 Transcript_103471/m.267621 type:complete len:95 (+) Transcript_103471:102-386(+)
MGLGALVEPAEGVKYGYIVALQALGCLVCLALFALERLVSQPGMEEQIPWMAGLKDSGWWVLPAPFLPALAYYSLVWMQPSWSKGENGVAKKEE